MLKVIKNQKYQTRVEVERAARRGRKSAIASSIRHWQELATAQVSDIVSVTCPDLTPDECTLCRRYRHSFCVSCPLYATLGGRRCYEDGEAYSLASTARWCARVADTKVQRDLYVKRFRRAAEKMLNTLKSIK